LQVVRSVRLGNKFALRLWVVTSVWCGGGVYRRSSVLSRLVFRVIFALPPLLRPFFFSFHAPLEGSLVARPHSGVRSPSYTRLSSPAQCCRVWSCDLGSELGWGGARFRGAGVVLKFLSPPPPVIVLGFLCPAFLDRRPTTGLEGGGVGEVYRVGFFGVVR